MKLVSALTIVLMFACSAISQTSQDPGAKALFRDTSVGTSVASTTEVRPGARSTSTPTTRPATPAPRPGSEVTALMYYVELIQPNGQALRVNANRVFHNGERIRFHVVSNANGRLTILQSENTEAFLPLFPHPQLRGGDNRVEQGKEVLIPMEFDNHPGNIRLMLMLTADLGSRPALQTASAPPGAAPAPAPPTPAAPTPPPVTLRAANDPPTARREGPISEAEIRALLRKQDGSKGLKIEVDNAPAEGATYVAADARQQSGLTAGTVAVEVSLTHQP